MAIIKVRNPAIDLDAAEIPNIDASKITTGSLGADRIPGLAASKITSGTFADARIAASNVSQHATSFDDNKLVNDISTLALRQASDQNKSAYNTNSQSVDVFQDDTGIDTTTNAFRNASEYVNTISSSTDSDHVFSLDMSTTNVDDLNSNSTVSIFNDGGGLQNETRSGSLDTYATRWDGSTDDWLRINDNDLLNLSGDFAIDWQVYFHSNAGTDRLLSKVASGGSPYEYYLRPHGDFYIDGRGSVGSQSVNNNQWYYFCVEAHGSNLNLYMDNTRVAQTTLTSSTNTNSSANLYIGGAWFANTNDNTQYPNMSLGGLRYKKGSARYNSASSITAPTTPLNATTLINNATGNFTGTTITAPSSVSSMGAIITYQDQAGTNALNTDIVLQLSADGGSNYSTATLTALPDFSTGIKMAKVNDLAVTAGTSLKYKLSFANQASGSKEARIRGVSLQY